LEKEALSVLNELWAKVSAREKFIVYGAAAVVVGWLLGIILGTRSEGVAGIYTVSVNYYSWGTAGLFDILAMLAGVATLVVVYLKVAPNMNITWPMPVVQIILGLTAVAAGAGVLALLFQVTNGLEGAPIFMYVADAVVIAGGAFAAYNAYLEYQAGLGK
jgi:hypothetical protein